MLLISIEVSSGPFSQTRSEFVPPFSFLPSWSSPRSDDWWMISLFLFFLQIFRSERRWAQIGLNGRHHRSDVAPTDSGTAGKIARPSSASRVLSLFFFLPFSLFLSTFRHVFFYLRVAVDGPEPPRPGKNVRHKKKEKKK